MVALTTALATIAIASRAWADVLGLAFSSMSESSRLIVAMARNVL